MFRTMVRRRLLFVTGILFVSAVLTLGAGTALAVGPDDFIRDMGSKAIDSLTARNITRPEREKRFRDILRRAFDMRTIARFTLGRYWSIASEKQRREYVPLLEDFIVQAYTTRFKDYNGQTLEVGKVHQINERDWLVVSRIVQSKGPPIRVNWRVRSNNGYRIVDVVVEGISMGITQRAEFAAVMRSNGGKVEGLLAALRRKTARN